MIELNETILLALLSSACAFAGVSATITLGFINWRIMRRHDISVDAYAHLKAAFTVIDELLTQTGWGGITNQLQFSQTRINSYEKHLSELVRVINLDKHKMQVCLGDETIPIYDNIHKLLNKYFRSCVILSQVTDHISNEKESAPAPVKSAIDFLTGEDKSYNDSRERCERKTDKIFTNVIQHPYFSYFCSKFCYGEGINKCK